ncbi:MAG TPA: hypothetical protein VF420_16340 [Casimicrobiaceae bacterium]
MSQRTDWKERIALTIRVGAIITILGFVVLSAERRITHDISTIETVAGEAALPFATPDPLARSAPETPAPGGDTAAGSSAPARTPAVAAPKR